MIHLLVQAAQAAQQTAGNSPFEWASQHIHLVGWGTVIWLVWKAGQFFSQAKTQVTKTVGQIDTMATNHFPHMERSIITMDKNIGRMAQHMTGDSDTTVEL